MNCFSVREKMKKINLHLIFFLSLSLMATVGFARDYIIYSIAQDIPMGDENEKINKNYYLNMGQNQGLKKGTIVDVFRVISRLDPYETKKRYNYKVKIGELKVLHTEQESSIAHLERFNEEKGNDLIYYDIPGFMIGDHINVKTD